MRCSVINGMTAAIHETAILGAGAKLGSNVRIGPYAIVEDEVELGSDCFVEAHAIVKNSGFFQSAWRDMLKNERHRPNKSTELSRA